MNIKFHTDNQETQTNLTLLDVDENQFFINDNGYLCQKVSNYAYNVIAVSQGMPLAYYKNLDLSDSLAIIYKILPKVTKITWE